MNHYFRKKKWTYGLYLVFVPLSCMASILFALSFQPVIDTALSGDLPAFVRASLGCILWGALDALGLAAVNQTKFRILASVKINLKEDLYRSILSFDYQHFCKENEGSYLSILNNDVGVLAQDYFEAKLMVYRVVWSFVVSFLAVSALSPIITVILIMIGLISLLIPQILGKGLTRQQEEYSARRGEYIARVKDILDGFLTIKNCHRFDYFEKQHQKINVQTEESGRKNSSKMYFATWISILCSYAMNILTLVTGGFLVIAGKMSAGLILSITQLSGGVVAPLEQVPALLSQIKSVKPIAEKCQAILCYRPDESMVKGEQDSLQCQELSFSYPGRDKGLQHVTKSFFPKKKYALVGESGSGKSTLAKLLAGCYHKDDGEIYYPCSFTPEQDIVYVPQDIHVFQTSVRENITLGEDFSEQELTEVLKQCCLMDWVQSLPNGLDEVLGEKYSCSGGEAQRIGLARALLRHPKMLILDEITSALDNKTAVQVEQNLLSQQNMMIVMVTHKLNEKIMQQYDEILLMQDGSLQECGTFEQLMEQRKAFYELYQTTSPAQK